MVLIIHHFNFKMIKISSVKISLTNQAAPKPILISVHGDFKLDYKQLNISAINLPKKKKYIFIILTYIFCCYLYFQLNFIFKSNLIHFQLFKRSNITFFGKNISHQNWKQENEYILIKIFYNKQAFNLKRLTINFKFHLIIKLIRNKRVYLKNQKKSKKMRINILIKYIHYRRKPKLIYLSLNLHFKSYLFLELQIWLTFLYNHQLMKQGKQRSAKQENMLRRRDVFFRRIRFLKQRISRVMRLASTRKIGLKSYLSFNRRRTFKANILRRTVLALKKLKRCRLTCKAFYDVIHPPKICLKDWLSERGELIEILDQMTPLLYQGLYGIEIRWNFIELGNKPLQKFAKIARSLNLDKYELWAMFAPYLAFHRSRYIWRFPKQWFTNEIRSKEIQSAYLFYFRTEEILASIHKKRIKYFKNLTGIAYQDCLEPHEGTVKNFFLDFEHIGIQVKPFGFGYDTFYRSRNLPGKPLLETHKIVFRAYKENNVQYIRFFRQLPDEQVQLNPNYALFERFLQQEKEEEERIDKLIENYQQEGQIESLPMIEPLGFENNSESNHL